MVLDFGKQVCILCTPDPYDIDLRDLRTEADLATWLDHLKEKSWATESQLFGFAELISAFRGFGDGEQE